MNINYKDSVKAINAAIEKSEEFSVPVTLAIVDTGGHLVNLARLDSVCGVVDFAIKKAKTAALFSVDSDAMGEMVSDAKINGYGMLNSNNGLLTLAGGVVIENKEGKIIGAIGSSGGTPTQDKEIATAGANALK